MTSQGLAYAVEVRGKSPEDRGHDRVPPSPLPLPALLRSGLPLSMLPTRELLGSVGVPEPFRSQGLLGLSPVLISLFFFGFLEARLLPGDFLLEGFGPDRMASSRPPFPPPSFSISQGRRSGFGKKLKGFFSDTAVSFAAPASPTPTAVHVPVLSSPSLLSFVVRCFLP